MVHVPLGTARFHIASTPEGEVLTVPARRLPFAVVFLSVWLVMWTVVGLNVLAAVADNFHLFTAFWLVGWVFGWCSAALILAWMLTGRETLRFHGSDLEITTSMLGLGRRLLFRGADIRRLNAPPGAAISKGRQVPPMPLLGASRGSVRFDYGARTRSFAFGMDDAEALQIVDWIRKRLPNV